MPSPVDKYFEEVKKENPSYSDEQAWATAWSIYCKHKNPGSEHCHRPPSGYLTDKAAQTIASRFVQAEETPKKGRPAKTYAQAQKDILQALKAKGWTVADGLKVPHATKGAFRFWFKSQAIYYSQGSNVKNFGEARSAWVPDYRHMTTEQMVDHLEDFAEKSQ